MEELKAKFEALSEEQQLEFIKLIMPTVCARFRQDPQQMMKTMMPFCQDLMRQFNMDGPQMMRMMMANVKPQP